jgi:hypothetical protein
MQLPGAVHRCGIAGPEGLDEVSRLSLVLLQASSIGSFEECRGVRLTGAKSPPTIYLAA